MKLRPFIYVLTTVVLVSCSTSNRLMGRTENLQGMWNCVSATVNGKPLPDATVEQLRLALTKDRYKTEQTSEVLFDSTYVLDPSKNPKQINMVGTEGDLIGKVAQGIYSIHDDTLTVCYTMPGKQRPIAFGSKVGSEAFLAVWKRQAR